MTISDEITADIQNVRSIVFSGVIRWLYLYTQNLTLTIKLLLLLHPFNGLFSRTTWVSPQRKGKLFWILLEQEMMTWQLRQLDHMQIICTSLQTDNRASTLPLLFYRPVCPSCHPTYSVKAVTLTIKIYQNLYIYYHSCFPVCRYNFNRRSLFSTISEKLVGEFSQNLANRQTIHNTQLN